MVITDIQSSSKLWSMFSEEMTADIEKHDRVLRHMMLLYNGIEVATEGDSFQVCLLPFYPVLVQRRSYTFLRWHLHNQPIARHRPCIQVVFRDAKDAARWCIAVQMQLLKVDWSTRIMEQCPEDAGVVVADSGATHSPVPPAIEGLRGGDQHVCSLVWCTACTGCHPGVSATCMATPLVGWPGRVHSFHGSPTCPFRFVLMAADR
jgi:hypothetical protein